MIKARRSTPLEKNSWRKRNPFDYNAPIQLQTVIRGKREKNSRGIRYTKKGEENGKESTIKIHAANGAYRRTRCSCW